MARKNPNQFNNKKRARSPFYAFIYTLSAIFSAAAISVIVLVVLVATNVINLDFEHKSNKKNLLIDKNAKSLVSPEFGFHYYVNGIKSSQNGTTEYFFNEAELKRFDQILKDSLAYGPEIFDLRSITFNNLPNQIEDVNGLYIPNTNEIYIDTSPSFGFNLSFEAKVNYVLPTLYHEYLHHFANSYLQNEKLNSELNDSSVLENNEKTLKGTPQNFNKTFLNKFKNLLNYDFTTQNRELDGFYGAREANKTFLAKTFNRRLCFCNVFSAADMFELANGSQLNQYRSLFKNNKLTTNSAEDNYEIANREVSNRLITLARALYLYSFAELIPREFTKLGYVPIFNKNNPGDKFHNAFGSYVGAGQINIDTYFDDISRSANLVNPRADTLNFTVTNPKLENYPYGGTFSVTNFLNRSQEAGEYANKSRQLYQTYLEALGYGNEINQIYAFNDASLLGGRLIKPATRQSFDKVKISGFLNYQKAKTYKALVLVDDQKRVLQKDNKILKANLRFLNFDPHSQAYNNSKSAKETSKRLLASRANLLSANEFTFKAKLKESDLRKTLGPNLLEEFQGPDLISYSTQSYLDLSGLKTINLAFWNDLNNNNKIETNELVTEIKEESAKRSISTMRNHSRNQTYYELHQKNIHGQKFLTLKRNQKP